MQLDTENGYSQNAGIFVNTKQRADGNKFIKQIFYQHLIGRR